MTLPGFDPKWRDFPDYIMGITKEIWEDRKISTLHQYYSEDIIVRTPSSVAVGNKGVIGATMATLAEFPDRTLLGEDVIWSGDENTGFLSSHRTMVCTEKPVARSLCTESSLTAPPRKMSSMTSG
jgi:hypothetical protein